MWFHNAKVKPELGCHKGCNNEMSMMNEKVKQRKQTRIVCIAIVFIVLSVLFVVISFFIGESNNTSILFVSSSVTFATLAGSILVFSTLDLQRNILNEEIRKNEIERFNSRFYPILSSFRTDALNLEIIGDCLFI